MNNEQPCYPVYRDLLEHPHSTAKEIAKRLLEEKTKINSKCLYAYEGMYFKKSDTAEYGWLAIEKTCEIIQVGDQGIPGYMGYKVGATGDGRSKRWKVLDRIMGGKLPNINSVEYMAKWGEPHSQERLHRLANHIAYFRNTHRDRHDADRFNDAIREWTDDLKYLKDTYWCGGEYIPC